MKTYSLLLIFLTTKSVIAQNIGIGTVTPVYKLDVNGTINTNVEYRIFGRPALRLASLSGIYRNTYLGDSSGFTNTTGYQNTFLGGYTGHNNSTGYKNTFIGTYAGFNNMTGYQNTFAGANAGIISTGFSNSFFGSDAGSTNTGGINNSFFGESAGKFNTTGIQNSFFGTSSGYSNSTANSNSFFGYKAGYSNTIGYSNVAIGSSALHSNTGNIGGTHVIAGLVAVGDSALYNNGLSATLDFHGSQNTAIGSKALYSNTYGHGNTSLGFHTLFSNTRGYYNTAVGANALYSNLEFGSENVAIGAIALFDNTTGRENTAVGSNASRYNEDQNGNTALGFQALYSNNGDYNTAIGYKAGVFAGFTPLTNCTAIGANAFVEQSNSIILGRIENAPLGWTLTRVGIGINAPAAALHIKANSALTLPHLMLEENGDDYARLRFQKTPLAGEFWDIAGNTNATNANARLNFFYNGVGDIFRIHGDGNATLIGTLTQLSDSRLKTSIVPLKNSLSLIMQLNGYKYNWKNTAQDQSVQIGLLAQEVKKVIPELIKTNEDGLMSVNYIGLIPVLVNALKEQQAQINELKSEIETIKAGLKN